MVASPLRSRPDLIDLLSDLGHHAQYLGHHALTESSTHTHTHTGDIDYDALLRAAEEGSRGPDDAIGATTKTKTGSMSPQDSPAGFLAASLALLGTLS